MYSEDVHKVDGELHQEGITMEKSRMNTAVDRRGMHSVQFEGQTETFDELHQQYISNNSTI